MTGPHLRVNKLLASEPEWLAVYGSGRSFALRSSEILFSVSEGSLQFGILDERGFRNLRIGLVEISDSRIEIDYADPSDNSPKHLTLIPRASFNDIDIELEASRLARVNFVCKAIPEAIPGAEVRTSAVAIAPEASRRPARRLRWRPMG